MVRDGESILKLGDDQDYSAIIINNANNNNYAKYNDFIHLWQ